MQKEANLTLMLSNSRLTYGHYLNKLLFITALWSTEGKGQTSWLLFVMIIVNLLLPIWNAGTGVILYCIDS